MTSAHALARLVIVIEGRSRKAGREIFRDVLPAAAGLDMTKPAAEQRSTPNIQRSTLNEEVRGAKATPTLQSAIRNPQFRIKHLESRIGFTFAS
jgi:hypothetical protein